MERGGNGAAPRGHHIEVKLWVKFADDEDESKLAPGWFVAVKHFDGDAKWLTNEPATVAQIVRIAKAVSHRTECNLMPYVETMTAQVIDSMDEAAQRRRDAIEAAEKALAELRRIDRYVEGETARVHAEVVHPEAVLEKQARQARQELEEALSYGES